MAIEASDTGQNGASAAQVLGATVINRINKAHIF